MNGVCRSKIVGLGCLLIGCTTFLLAEQEGRGIEAMVKTSRVLGELSFSQVVWETTGKKVIPFDPGDPVNSEMLRVVAEVCDEVQKWCNHKDQPLSRHRRINEASQEIENQLNLFFNRNPDFECSFAKNEKGKIQRSGYPDLRLLHRPSGHVIYIDPKLVGREGESSSLRSFYYDPSGSQKILEDASHWVLGFIHDGESGKWRILDWKIVDMSAVKVRLKAEFQASNADLYQERAVLMNRNSQNETQKTEPNKNSKEEKTVDK